MAIVALTNSSSPVTVERATADSDPYERETQLNGLALNFDAHDHTSAKGLAVGRLQSPAVSGVMTFGGDATLSRTGPGALRADTNLGVGVAPAAWGSTSRALQVGQAAALSTYDDATFHITYLTNNLYHDGTNRRAMLAGRLSELGMNEGTLTFYNTPTAPGAGAVATMKERLNLNPTGTLTLTPDAGQPGLRTETTGGVFTTIGPGTWVTNHARLASTSTLELDAATLVVAPSQADNTSLGHSARRWSVVYAVAGAINTSSREAKEGITPLDPLACYQAAKDVRWYEFAYLPPAYQEPEPPPDIAYDAADDNETKAEKKALRDEAEAQARAAHLKMVAETASARHQRGFVYPAGPETKDEAGGTLPPVPDLFGLSDRESTTPQADLATLGCALQEVIRRLEALEGAA